jgi:hypothetical protein
MKSFVRVAGVAAMMGMGVYALAQGQPADAPSLQSLLVSQYKPARTALGPTGTTVIEAGKVFVVKRGGLFAVPPTSFAFCPAQFKDGELHPPGGLCISMSGVGTRFLDVGTKVYITKIEVNQKKNSIGFSLIECDSCNGVTQPSSYKSSVGFQFAPKYLDTAEPGQLADVINQVLEADTGATAGTADTGTPAPPPATTPAAQPAQIQLGDSPAQVEAILGPPDTKVPLGSKLIYIYKNLKVTFVSDKVTDVQ